MNPVSVRFYPVRVFLELTFCLFDVLKIPSKIKAGCGALFLFFTGSVCGFLTLLFLIAFLVPRLDEWRTPRSKEFLAKHFSKRLRLSDSQTEELRPGFFRFLEQKWQLRSDYLNENGQLVEEYVSSIKDELDPKQQQRVTRVKNNWWKENRKRIKQAPET